MNATEPNGDARQTLPPPYGLIALICAAALAYELLLMRLLAIVHWHHFAGLVISLALLGIGVSGSVISVWQRTCEQHFAAFFCASLAGFALSSVGCVLLAQAIPFNALALLWETRQLGYLAALYSTLAIPFFWAGSAVLLALCRFREQAAKVYAADLIGAGMGVIVTVIALQGLLPITVLRGVAAVLLAAASTAIWRYGQRWRVELALLLLSFAIAAVTLPDPWFAIRSSDYKPVRQLLRIPDSRVLLELSNPLALTTVIDSGQIPLRRAPDLSLYSRADIPSQLGVFRDGETQDVLIRYLGERQTLQYLDELPSALPYHLSQPHLSPESAPARPLHVLILGNVIGSLLQAEYHGAAVTVVEANPQTLHLIQDHFSAYSGWSFWHEHVQWQVREPRVFLASGSAKYDLIQLAVTDAASSIAEQYLYTEEALSAAWLSLSDTGQLALTLPLQAPPLALFKMTATVQRMLINHGIAEPEPHVAIIHGNQTAVMIVQRSPLSALQHEAMLSFARQHGFTPIAYPAMPASERSLTQHAELVRALLQSASTPVLADYPFDLRPATDDRPFFLHFFRFDSARQLLALREQGGLALLDWGYPMLLIALVQAGVLSLLLIGLPLCWQGRRTALERTDIRHETCQKARHENGWPRWRYAGYFLSIGVAFMALELAFLQKFILLLGQPLYAAAVVLACFLFGAGLGSRWAAGREMRLRCWPFLAVVVVAALVLALLQRYSMALLALPTVARWSICIGFTFLLAFWLGMPMPLGLARTAAQVPERLPWAWAINGCASVVGALLVTVLAIDVGFSGVVLLAILLYLGAMWLYR